MKRQLSKEEKICICAVEVMGREFLGAAYLLCHPKTRAKSESSLAVMQSRWFASAWSKAFRREMRAKISGMAIVQGAELTTRSGILERLQAISRSLNGKDELSALQLLAKMQGLDRPDEHEDNSEKRVYFLPWVSSCRNCALMKIYMKMQNNEK